MLKDASVGRKKPVAPCRLGTCKVKSIHTFDAMAHDRRAICRNRIFHLNINGSPIHPITNFVYLIKIRTLPKFAIQNLAPRILHRSRSHQVLYAQLRLRFKANTQLRLIVERAVVAAVVEIDPHADTSLRVHEPKTQSFSALCLSAIA